MEFYINNKANHNKEFESLILWYTETYTYKLKNVLMSYSITRLQDTITRKENHEVTNNLLVKTRIG